MAVIKSEIKQHTIVNPDGTSSFREDKVETITEHVSSEPEFIKIYIKMYCEFQGIDPKYRQLFLQLVLNMSYCDKNDLKNSQIVYVLKPASDKYLELCGWKTKDPLMKGLKSLCDCKAIRRISRGVYQINPFFAGRGGWRYNPRTKQGGIQDLVAIFDIPNKQCDTKIIWADDGTDSDLNQMYRDGMGVKASNETQISSIRYENDNIEQDENNGICDDEE